MFLAFCFLAIGFWMFMIGKKATDSDSDESATMTMVLAGVLVCITLSLLYLMEVLK